MPDPRLATRDKLNRIRYPGQLSSPHTYLYVNTGFRNRPIPGTHPSEGEGSVLLQIRRYARGMPGASPYPTGRQHQVEIWWIVQSSSRPVMNTIAPLEIRRRKHPKARSQDSENS